MKDTHIYNFQIRVLISKEDGEICAHALELDLLGYGKTENEAIELLLEAIDCQISFARSKNDDSVIAFPASKEFYEKWEAAHMAEFKSQIIQDKAKKIAVKAVYVDISDKLSNSSKNKFEAMEMTCA